MVTHITCVSGFLPFSRAQAVACLGPDVMQHHPARILRRVLPSATPRAFREDVLYGRAPLCTVPSIPAPRRVVITSALFLSGTMPAVSQDAGEQRPRLGEDASQTRPLGLCSTSRVGTIQPAPLLAHQGVAPSRRLPSVAACPTARVPPEFSGCCRRRW